MDSFHNGPWTIGPDPNSTEDCPSVSIWAEEGGTSVEVAGRICDRANAEFIVRARAAASPNVMPDTFFRELAPNEVKTMRDWARANWKPGEEINEVWHPVVRAECKMMEWEAFGWPFPERIEAGLIQPAPRI